MERERKRAREGITKKGRRARKAAEKAREQAEKKKKTQEKMVERAKKAQEKAAKTPATRKTMRSTATSIDGGALDKELRSKTPKAIDDSIDFDRYACFGLYADDAGTDCEWIECFCSRWIHEDCVENVIYDANGKKLLCPVCLSSV